MNQKKESSTFFDQQTSTSSSSSSSMTSSNNSNSLPPARNTARGGSSLTSKLAITCIVVLMVFGLFGISSARSRHSHNKDESFKPSKECYHRYAHKDHHESFAGWLHHKNSSHYSPISPSYHQALVKIQANDLEHGLQVTSGVSSCNTRKMKVVSSSTPLRERALCQFEYVLNYKPNRIPSTLTEVRCSCPRPAHQLVGKRMFECEPLRYQVRVLLFDSECLTYVEHTETLALACIPVLQANANASDEHDDLLVPIPAEAPADQNIR